MTPDFWRRVDEARPSDRDPELHAGALVERRVDAGVDVTLEYAAMEVFEAAGELWETSMTRAEAGL